MRELISIFIIALTLLQAKAFACTQFTDQILSDYISNYEEVIFYPWNPYMPLSIQGLRDSRPFVEERGIKLVPLLDPTYYGALPDEELYEVDDTCFLLGGGELLEKNASNHFPGYFYYRSGEFVGHLYGYTFSERLEKLLIGVRDD